MGLSESLVLKWKDRLLKMGWPEDSVKVIVTELCEAGYRKCIEDIQERAKRDEEMIQKAVN